MKKILPPFFTVLLIVLEYACAGTRQNPASEPSAHPQEIDLSEPNPVPTWCMARERYPEFIRKAAEAIPDHSGLKFTLGTSRQNCQGTKGCRLFTKAEFEKATARKMANFSDSALFSIAPCRTEKDEESIMQRDLKAAVLISNYVEESELRKFMEGLQGEWCGRPRSEGNKNDAEIRILFNKEKEIVLGRGTVAWRRLPTAPLGEPGFVRYVTVVPMHHEGGLVRFSEISRFRNTFPWWISKTEKGLEAIGVLSERSFDLVRSCEGFWREGP